MNLNQQVFQLLGLGWAEETNRRLRRFVEAILEQQQSDGGWAQLKGLNSDAWATGLALLALHTAGNMATTDDVYQKGVRFLLKTQFGDGSWYVKSRAWPFQPHFESGFPHGKDQWISAGGTAWATMALLLTQPKTGERPAHDWMAMEVPDDYARNSDKVERVQGARAQGEAPTVDYHRDVKPILESSCHGCHGRGGVKNKGGFDITARESFLKGGQSSDPVVILGKSQASPLILMVTDQLEDFEMPPLSKREKYPKLSPDKIGLLKAWIDQGLRWETGVPEGDNHNP